MTQSRKQRKEQQTKRNHLPRRQGRAMPVIAEALEDRQLLSLTLDVRAVGGAKSQTVSAVGDTVNLQVWAVVIDAQNAPTTDGLVDAFTSFVSTGNSNSVDGNLTAQVNSSFMANGFANGTPQDLNGDGNTDVGGTNTASATGFFFARYSNAPSADSSADSGVIVGNSVQFLIGTLTYTVTNLNVGVETDINAQPRVSNSKSFFGAIWREDNTGLDNTTGTYQAGAPFRISDPALTPAPVAVNDSALTARNSFIDINVLANDTTFAALNPTTVAVVGNPAHGTATPNSDGTIHYVPTTDFIGTDSFTYTVADVNGKTSSLATVNVNVVPAIPPTVVADSASVVLGGSVTIPVLSNDTPVAGFNLGSVVISSAPANGTATAQSDGTIIYTPAGGSIGIDTFTYTVADQNGARSDPATVSVNVGTEISSALRANHAISYTDVGGGATTITLNRGVADVFFDSNGSVTTRLGRITITGSHSITSMTLSGTSAVSALVVQSRGGSGAASLGSIIDSGVLGRIIGTGVLMTGAVTLGGLSSLTVPAISAATMQIGGGAALLMNVQSIRNSTVNAPSKILTVLATKDISGSTLSASDTRIFRALGGFNSSTIALTGSTVPLEIVGTAISASSINAPGERLIFVAGSISNSTIQCSSPQVISASAINSSQLTFGGAGRGTMLVSGAVTNSTVAAAGAFNLFSAGSFSGSSLAGSSANLLRVIGNVTGSTMSFSAAGAFSVAHAIFGGTVESSSLSTVGNILAISARVLSNSQVSAGTVGAQALDTVNAANVGNATIGSIVLTNRVGTAFSGSTVIAHTITTSLLGTIDPTSSGEAAVKFGSVTASFNSVTKRVGPAQLANEAALQSYAAANSAGFVATAVAVLG